MRTQSPPRGIIGGAAEPRRSFVATLKRDDAQGGFGVNFSAEDANVVASVAKGSSAARAGVLPGDELLAVAGLSVSGRGPAGLRKALTHLLAEERRLQQLYGTDTVRPHASLSQRPRHANRPL